MTRIIGIAGSLRRGSYNAALLRAAAESAPANSKIETASIRGIPLYDGDVEAADGIPAAVTQLKDLVAGADALLLVTPEYNHSIPGVLKNAIDWMTRPGADIARVFGNKPVGLIGATPGGLGTAFSQTAWLPVLHTLGTRMYTGRSLYVSNAAKVFDGEGKLVDAAMQQRLRSYLEGFVDFIHNNRRQE
ncbi:MAG: NADPH-dependent FMN reductase [Gammaproteobacteria bacterium]